MKVCTLADKVGEQILEELKFGKFHSVRLLPPEEELAKILGVSRNVIRSSLSVLEQEGYVSRRRGVGTVVNHHVLDIRTRIDIADLFQRNIETEGCEAGCSYFHMEKVPCCAYIAEMLGIHPGDPIYKIARAMTANGIPAVYDIDYLAARLIDGLDDASKLKAAEESTFAVLQQAGNDEIHMAITKVSAVAADENVALHCGKNIGDPVLFMEAVQYTFSGEPLFVSQEYYVNALNHQKMIRKKIYSSRETNHVCSNE